MAKLFLSTIFAAAVALAQTPPAPSPEAIAFFETKIRPVLAGNCFTCHSHEGKVSRGGLVLDTKLGPLMGGDSGPAIVPGDVEKSLLIQAIRRTGERKMPPGRPLCAPIVADFEKWVAMGAPDPRESTQVVSKPASINWEIARKFWAFAPPVIPAAPKTVDTKWATTPIDKFVLAKLEAKKLKPVADADRATLIRRVYLDLTGVPPSPEQVDAFVADKSKDAYEKVVDQLLASPLYGERWGRHWLDVARYGETTGRTRNAPFPVAWKYRDWVIDAFNKDLPYDQFIVKQIAGDLLRTNSVEEKNANQIATGFLALSAVDLNELDKRQYDMDNVDEQIHVVSKAFMGLTVGCARCHDHKFDPIPAKDYYAMAGIFRSTELLNGLRRRPQFNQIHFNDQLLVKLDGIDPYPGKDATALAKARADMWEKVLTAERSRDRIKVRDVMFEWLGQPMPENLAMGVREADRKVESEIMLKGDPHNPAERVERGSLRILAPEGSPLRIPKEVSGRLELAQWIARADNPTTARVMANRIWLHLFGRAIVDTPDNFGRSGSMPTHRELLDHLALRLVANGWSTKKTIREIVLSRTYKLSSNHDAQAHDVDPDNKLLWRANRNRLEVEAIRDSILHVSGKLDTKQPEGSPITEWASSPNRPRQQGRIEAWELTQNYRSVYVPVVRNQPNRFFETFDFPEPSEPKGKRDVTTVAPQALFLMNSPFVAGHAKVAAERLLRNYTADKDRVTRAYREVYGRAPSAKEIDQSLTYVQTVKAEGQEVDAWAKFYQALFASAEFRYRT
ncbi:MAG: DUF1549 domain-containing protein [Acidobacteria bacterium]|nr:DUF1549 domain-containing protein [Acidobacteriota bacterium]